MLCRFRGRVTSLSKSLGEISYLAGALLPHPHEQLARDLLLLLGCIDLCEHSDGVIRSPFQKLEAIRQLAWLGYKSPSLLAKIVEDRLGATEIGIRFSLLVKELTDKRCQHVFLPTVASIARHQSDRLPKRVLVDHVFETTAPSHELTQTSCYVLQLSKVPYRIRCILMLAATTRLGVNSGCFEQGIMTVAARASRSFYDDPSTSLKHYFSNCSAYGPTLGSQFHDMAREINHVSAGALWIDALYHAECSMRDNVILVHTFSIEPKDIGH